LLAIPITIRVQELFRGVFIQSINRFISGNVAPYTKKKIETNEKKRKQRKTNEHNLTRDKNYGYKMHLQYG